MEQKKTYEDFILGGVHVDDDNQIVLESAEELLNMLSTLKTTSPRVTPKAANVLGEDFVSNAIAPAADPRAVGLALQAYKGIVDAQVESLQKSTATDELLVLAKRIEQVVLELSISTAYLALNSHEALIELIETSEVRDD